MSITFLIIAVTVLVSMFCFKSSELFSALSLNPYRMVEKKEWWRILTHGFVHGDYVHLMINMLVLYSFGSYVESYFKTLGALGVINNPVAAYLILYFGGMVFSTVHDLVKNRKDPYFSSIGASGAVSAVVFSTIFFEPWGKILLFGVIPIPGILFGVLYMAYSQCRARQEKDNINHLAHFYGALFGFVFPVLLSHELVHVFFDAFRF